MDKAASKSPVLIAGPHMGFNPESHLGGERYEANWMQVMTNPMLQFSWVVREGLGHTETLSPNHHFKTIKRDRGLRRILAEAKSLRAINKKQPVDLYRFHSVHYGAPTAAMLRASGVRTPILFQHLHVEEPKKKYMARAKLMARLGAHFVSISQASHEELVALGVPKAQSSAIQTIILDWKAAHTNMALTAPNEKDYDIVYVGGLIPRKRPEMVINVGIELQKMSPGKKIELAVIGRGEMLDELQKQAAQAGLQVDFFTNADDEQKWDILRRSRIFLFPSSQEGFGYAPLEAALAGLWVVSSAAGSLPEVLTGMENATCIKEEAFHAAYLASICREKLKNPPKPVQNERVKHWTDRERWRKEHEKLLFQLAGLRDRDSV